MLQILYQIVCVHCLRLCDYFLDEIRSESLGIYADNLVHIDSALNWGDLSHGDYMVGDAITAHLVCILGVVGLVSTGRLYCDELAVLPLMVVEA